MAQNLLESSALSAFCGSVATMLSAGIQTEEAVLMLAENRERSRFQEVCNTMYAELVNGSTFSQAMATSEGFPHYAVEMAATGEQSGHLEAVLRNLELYYDEEDRMFAKLRSSVGYPAALLVIMAVILLFTIMFILPVFADVYENMAGSLASTSLTSIGASTIIGWVAFIVTVIVAIIALYLSFSTRRNTFRCFACGGACPRPEPIRKGPDDGTRHVPACVVAFYGGACHVRVVGYYERRCYDQGHRHRRARCVERTSDCRARFDGRPGQSA